MSSHNDNLPVLEADLVANPGLPEHEWRPTDVDPDMERRAERQVAFWFLLSMVSTVLFLVSYFAFAVGEDPDTFLGLGSSTLFLGLTLGIALLSIGIGIIQWARKLMGDHEIVEYRHSAASSPEDREETLAVLALGAEESGIGRRPLIRNTMLGALGLVGLTPIIALRDLGPLPGDTLASTIWTKGMYVVQRRRRHPHQGLRGDRRRPRQRPAGGAVHGWT